MKNANTSKAGAWRQASWRSPSKLVSAIVRQSREEGPLDAHSVLAAHPELRDAPSALVDLAYEEYCQRADAGQPADAQEFAARFPECRTSLLRLLDLHKLLEHNPDLLQGPAGWPAEGEVFLGYELLEELGQGAFSRVFLARERALGNRAVVVKITRHGGAEAQALGMMAHDHIVPVYSVKEDAASGLWAICMPYLGRLTCHDVLDRAFSGGKAPRTGRVIVEALFETAACGSDRRRGAAGDEHDAGGQYDAGGEYERRHGDAGHGAAGGEYDPGGEGRGVAAELVALGRAPYVDAVLHLAWQLADALRCAHERGVYHCDIKPSNVLLTRRDGAMLLDFNLALVPDHTREMGGTLPYMAPEQLRGLAAGKSRYAVDGKTDVFSLGVMLYEMLGGSLPWGRVPTDASRGKIAEELLARQEKGPRSLERLNGGVDGRLARLVRSCLSVEADQRPTAAELSESLKRELCGVRRAARALLSRRRSLLATACVLGVGSFLCSWAFGRIEPWSDGKKRLARGAFAEGDFDRAGAYLDELLEEEPDDPDALFLRARCCFRLRRYKEAVRDLDRLEKEFPDNTSIAALRGSCLAGDPTADRETMLAALKCLFQAKDDEQLLKSAMYNNIGACLRRLPDPVRAEVWLKRAIAVDAGCFAARFNLGLTLRQLARLPQENKVSRLRQARVEFERAAALNDRVKHVHLQLAETSVDLWQAPELDEGERDAAKAKAARHAQRALELGGARSEVEPVCRVFLDVQIELKKLLDVAPATPSPVPMDFVLDPFGSWAPPSLLAVRSQAR
jgi:serine/threonine protein kinase/Tfp pilus assembly protein PilF